MPSRSIRDERRKVGPADAATRRQALKERLAEREPSRYGKSEKQSDAARPAASNLSARGAVNAIRDRKYRDRKLIDEAG
jgi:hypothetical protein